jgi:hypothetical protein
VRPKLLNGDAMDKDDNDRVVSFAPRLEAKLKGKADYFLHVDRPYELCRLLGIALEEMRKLGATEDEMASTLRHAADVLQGLD